jgi:hypothetical protein
VLAKDVTSGTGALLVELGVDVDVDVEVGAGVALEPGRSDTPTEMVTFDTVASPTAAPLLMLPRLVTEACSVRNA